MSRELPLLLESEELDDEELENDGDESWEEDDEGAE